MAVMFIGCSGLMGHIFHAPMLYWDLHWMAGSALSAYPAVLLVCMSIWLFLNYFPNVHYSTRLPSLNKLVERIISVNKMMMPHPTKGKGA